MTLEVGIAAQRQDTQPDANRHETATTSNPRRSTPIIWACAVSSTRWPSEASDEQPVPLMWRGDR